MAWFGARPTILFTPPGSAKMVSSVRASMRKGRTQHSVVGNFHNVRIVHSPWFENTRDHYSYAGIKNLQPRRPVTLVIQGLAAAGKTTVAEAVARDYNWLLIKEYHEWAALDSEYLRSLRSPTLSVQRIFAEIDVARTKKALSSGCPYPGVVFDADYMSCLAYVYSAVGSASSVLANTLALYRNLLNNRNVIVPDGYVYLEVPREIRLQRRDERPHPPASIYFDLNCTSGMQTFFYNYFKFWDAQRILIVPNVDSLDDVLKAIAKFAGALVPRTFNASNSPSIREFEQLCRVTESNSLFSI